MRKVILMMHVKFLFMILAFLCITTSSADWLEGGYVGSPDYGEIRQYFTDPIFYMRVPATQPLRFFRPGQSFYPIANMSTYPPYAWQSEFRNRSLAAMQWESFEKNWTATVIYAKGRSSFRVLEKGAWKNL